MEAGKAVVKGSSRAFDLVDAMVVAADDSYSDEDVATVERSACPTCGSCSGMFTANSMNCLTEALGPGAAGQRLGARHAQRSRSVCSATPGRPSSISPNATTKATMPARCRAASPARSAFENAMSLDIAMGGSTNTVLHLLAAAQEGEVDFSIAEIDALSRRVPCLCKVAPAKSDVHMEDVHRAGGIMAILGELDRAGLLDTSLPTIHSSSMGEALARWDMMQTEDAAVENFYRAAPGGVPSQTAFSAIRALGQARYRSKIGRHSLGRASVFR